VENPTVERQTGVDRSKLSDTDLIIRYLGGDEASFEVLVTRHQKEAVRIAYSVLGNEADAVDASQDAFIKVFRNLATFGGRSRFSTWFYRIVYNSALDIARRRKRFIQHVEDEDHERQFTPGESRGDGDAPDEILGASERDMQVWRCLQKLPSKYRTVIRLKDIENLSYEDIAKILGISRGNVMSRLYYGRTKLRRLISEELGEQ
jgi:RNA polymerase sigma-70 factor (ECF subfamily)